MKKVFVYLFPVCLTILLCGCGTNKSVYKNKKDTRKSSLTHWVQPQDSANASKRNVSGIKTKEDNLKRMQYNVDKEKNNPYSGELLYHIFRDLLKK